MSQGALPRATQSYPMLPSIRPASTVQEPSQGPSRSELFCYDLITENRRQEPQKAPEFALAPAPVTPQGPSGASKPFAPPPSQDVTTEAQTPTRLPKLPQRPSLHPTSSVISWSLNDVIGRESPPNRKTMGQAPATSSSLTPAQLRSAISEQVSVIDMNI